MNSKIASFLGTILIFFSLSTTIIAGDIPESLIWNDGAQIFFGEVIDYYPDKNEPSISVSPVKKIKGDVNIGSKQTYMKPNPMGGAKITEGNVYLFTYYDEVNPLDIFEVTSYDTKTLKIKGVQGDMWERFEEYINNGEYEKAELERNRGQSSEIYEYSNLPPINNGNCIIFQNIVFIFILPELIGVIIRLLFIKLKKGYIVSGIFAAVAFVLCLKAALVPSHGSEGPGIFALMAALLTAGSLFIEVVLLLIKKLKNR